ncbi:MAG TPA: WYL domain-containing protein [Thermodesulfobacteriota bacterium]|nr:WYL domain-containing protein [Thermodesulfobacteriota bacterium]
MDIPEPIGRFDRIYYLIEYLAGLRRGVTVKEIAEAVNKHERTVRRDIRTLDSIFGIKLIRERGFDRKARFRIEKRDVSFRPLVFNTYEILALYFARGFSHFNDIPFIQRNLADVFTKIREAAEKYSPQERRDFFNRVSNLFMLPRELGGKVYSESNIAFLRQLIDAALDYQVCELSYGLGDKIKKYNIAPLHFFNYRDAIYLLSKDLGDNIIKTFALHRIKEVNTLNEHFEYPSQFDVKSFLSKSPFSSEGDKRIIKLRFSPDIKEYILDREWFPNEKKEVLQNGSLLLTFVSDINMILIGWIRGFGSDVIVLKPIKLRQYIINDIRKNLRKYNKY